MKRSIGTAQASRRHHWIGDLETEAFLRVNNPTIKDRGMSQDDEGYSGRTGVIQVRQDESTSAPIPHNPAYRKTFEERYHVRSYKELRQ